MAAHNQLKWRGLLELKAALRNLPSDLASEAAAIIAQRAEEAAATVRNNYESHVHTGHLADNVVVTTLASGPFGAGASVRAKSPHAYIFEYGSAARRLSNGANRGVMPPAPPAHAFVPVLQRTRRALYDRDLRALLQRAGLTVTGDV